MQKTKEIQQELEQYIDPVKREYLPNFFKTGKGQYGEGDKFLGIVVPNTRMVAKRHKDVPFEVMVELLQSEWHVHFACFHSKIKCTAIVFCKNTDAADPKLFTADAAPL